MNDLELIFSMLGEAATTEITKTQDAQGFDRKPHRRPERRAHCRHASRKSGERNKKDGCIQRKLSGCAGEKKTSGEKVKNT